MKYKVDGCLGCNACRYEKPCVQKDDFAIVNYLGFRDKGRLLAGGCGDSNGDPAIGKTRHLDEAYQFGKNIYYGEQ